MADAEKIKHSLACLAKFTSAEGEITRQTFSNAWENAVLWVKREMEMLGMATRIDGFGNLTGLYNPAGSPLKPIGIGSHIDTVINGGAYDGAIGIAAGLELARTLQANKMELARPVEVIAFAEEEGGVFGKGCLGSEYITAHTPLDKLDLFLDSEGRSARLRAARCPLNKEPYGSDYGWGRDHFYAFYEIHAEQGGFLEEKKKRIGIVDGVVGILRSEVTFTGQANHAGTTLMKNRKDAMAALSAFILGAYQYGIERNGRLTVTNGKIRVEPNQHNVVPGKASSVCELRAETDEEIRNAFAGLREYGQSVARQQGLQVHFSDPVYVKPVRFSEHLARIQSRAAEGRDDTMHIFSWAGHDAKLMSTVAPAMMLFVPSRNGMSHCPQEYSSPEDVAAATDFLLQVLKEIK